MKNLLLFLGLFLTFSLTTVSCGGGEDKNEENKEVTDETASCCKDGEKCDPAKCKKDGKCDPAKCKAEGKSCDHSDEGKCSEGKCSEGKCADKCGEGKCGEGDSSDSTSKCGEDNTEGSKC